MCFCHVLVVVVLFGAVVTFLATRRPRVPAHVLEVDAQLTEIDLP